MRFLAHSERVLASNGYEKSVRGYLRTLPTIGYTYDSQTVRQILRQISIPETAPTQSNNVQGNAAEVNPANSSLDIPPDGATVLASSMTKLPQFSTVDYPSNPISNESNINRQPSEESQFTYASISNTNSGNDNAYDDSNGFVRVNSIHNNQEHESVTDNNSWGSLGTGTHALIVLTRLSDNKTYPVAAYEATIGRSLHSLIHVSGNSDISRIHVTVEISGDGFEITDMGSRNGTYVNGTRLAPQQSIHAPSPVRLR